MPPPIALPEGFEGLAPEYWRLAKDYFLFDVDFLPLAAGTTVTRSFTVENDADWLMRAITGTARDPNAVTTVFLTPAITIQIQSTGSGRNAFNRATDWRNVVGIAQDVYTLPLSKWFNANSTVDITLANLSAAQDYDVRLAFHGFKMFGFPWGAS